jgi:hypothetical protein
MTRRQCIGGVVAALSVVVVPTGVLAYDSSALNQRIVGIARQSIGKPVGARYNSWVFGYLVQVQAGARGPYHGPVGQYAWGRPISWAEVQPGDFIQIESPTAFRVNGCGKVYWSCTGRCTWIVLGRTNGRRPGSVIEVAYQYKQHVVRYARIETMDKCAANQIYFYRPQSR